MYKQKQLNDYSNSSFLLKIEKLTKWNFQPLRQIIAKK